MSNVPDVGRVTSAVIEPNAREAGGPAASGVCASDGSCASSAPSRSASQEASGATAASPDVDASPSWLASAAESVPAPVPPSVGVTAPASTGPVNVSVPVLLQQKSIGPSPLEACARRMVVSTAPVPSVGASPEPVSPPPTMTPDPSADASDLPAELPEHPPASQSAATAA